MKQLYIRRGNLSDIQDILIIGEESKLGSRDSAYKPKGMPNYNYLFKKDPYSGTTNLLYVHACRNINLNTRNYKSDHDIHRYIKKYCRDLVKWDGEANSGYTNSREAFICKSDDVDRTILELYNRIQSVVHPNGFLQKARSSLTYVKKSRKSHKKPHKSGLFLFVLIVLIASGFKYTSDFSNRNLTYDYRYKMDDDKDKILLRKLKGIIADENLIDEAYYTTREINNNKNWAVHFYEDKKYTVVRVKSGLTEQQEQKAINEVVEFIINEEL